MMRDNSVVTFMITLMLITISLPLVSASVSVALSANPTSQSATSDNAAEYTITIQNSGDDDATVSLSTSQAADCNGYTSSLEDQVVSVNAGSSESTTLTVSLGESAGDSCETTVSASAVGQSPTDTDTDDITVETTNEDGGGQYSVQISVQGNDPQLINYDSEEDGDQVKWELIVENTGEQSSAMQIEVISDGDCDSDGLSATSDKQTTGNLGSGDTEQVEITVDIPDEGATEADSHCFIIKATVTQDPNAADRAEDNITLTVKIPQLKECEASLQKTAHSLDPLESASNYIALTNIGNTEWTVSAVATSDEHDVQDWVDFEAPLSKLLSEPGGSQDSHTFSFTITPDDSVEPGTIPVYIQGRAGTSVGCQEIVYVTVGQSKDASISLSTSKISNAEPGTTQRIQVAISNTGNGQDTYAVGTSGLPSGWQVSMSQSSVTIDGKHCGPNNCNKQSLDADIMIPSGALANIQYSLSFYVNSGGNQHDVITLDVTVAAVHSVTTTLASDAQTGKFAQIVQFPLSIENIGNIRDTLVLEVCNPNINSTCSAPAWNSSFSNSQGNSISSITLDPEEIGDIFVDIQVEDPFDNSEEVFEIRVGIIGSSFQSTEIVKVTVSNYNYSMAISFESPGENPSSSELSLPPGGSHSTSFWIDNTGNGGVDEAIISISGMDSSVFRSIKIDGVTSNNEILIPAESRVLVEIELEVIEGIESGNSGTITVSVSSKKNTAQMSSITFNIDVIIIHDLQYTMDSSPEELSVKYPQRATFTIYVTNNGNTIEKVEIITPAPLREWSVDVVPDDFLLNPGQTKEVEIRVTSPVGLKDDDTYKFTLIIQPEDTPVAGQPIELTVRTEVSKLNLANGILGEILVYGSIIIGSILVLTLFLRARKENKIISEALLDEQQD
ncbi:MAG: putative membrane protein [Candidatus Thalassarchaeaceae archaeon]|jgi:uncharacterized membrane protein